MRQRGRLGYRWAVGAVSLAGACTTREIAPAVPAPPPPPPAIALDTTLPNGALGVSIRRGQAILMATRDSLPDHVGNDLRCASCHLNNGRNISALPWIGVYARFPQYRSRSATVSRLEDRINDCFERSLGGTSLPFEHPAMRDIVAYMAFLSQGTAVVGRGAPPRDPMFRQTAGDTVLGAQVYAAECARCHAADGTGTDVAPPVWGPRSFTIGAGMARFRTAAAFIKQNMPFDRPGTLTDAQALNVAAYVTSRSRPDFAAKAEDWPLGDPPPDVAYPTSAGRRAAGKTR